MRKPRTKKELLDDPRVAKIGSPYMQKESDILWKEEDGYGNTDEEMDKPSYWCVLAEGWNRDGCSSLHAKTIKGLINQLETVEKGSAY